MDGDVRALGMAILAGLQVAGMVFVTLVLVLLLGEDALP